MTPFSNGVLKIKIVCLIDITWIVLIFYYLANRWARKAYWLFWGKHHLWWQTVEATKSVNNASQINIAAINTFINEFYILFYVWCLIRRRLQPAKWCSSSYSDRKSDWWTSIPARREHNAHTGAVKRSRHTKSVHQQSRESRESSVACMLHSRTQTWVL